MQAVYHQFSLRRVNTQPKIAITTICLPSYLHHMHCFPEVYCRTYLLTYLFTYSFSYFGLLLLFEYYNEIFKVEIFQGRNINSEKNPSSRWDLNPRPSVILH